MKVKIIVFWLVLLAITFGLNGVPANGYFQNSGPRPVDTKPGTAIRLKSLGPVSPGRETTLSFELESSAKVNVVSFTLNFDPSVFSYVSTSLGTDRPESSHLALNTQQTATGKLGVLVDSPFAFANGKNQMITAVFRVSAGATPGTYPFSFGSSPAQQGVATTDQDMVKAEYETGNVVVGPERKAIVGRVLDQNGTGVWHTKVTLIGPDGKEKTYTTGSFGSFVFDDLTTGPYTISAKSKRYSFAPKNVDVKGTFTEVEFLEAT